MYGLKDCIREKQIGSKSQDPTFRLIGSEWIWAGISIYAQIIERTGMFTCQVIAYSGAAPFGERGEINVELIENIMTADDFQKARRLNWPDHWE